MWPFDLAKKRRERILRKWGVPKPHRENQYYANRLHEIRPEPTGLDAQTAADLDFPRLFSFLDRTSSIIGRQVLYDRLLRNATIAAEREQLERAVAYYAQNDVYPALEALDALQEERDYIYPTILYADVPMIPRHRGIVRAFQLLSFACLLFGLVYPVLYVAFIPLLAINLFLHYRLKQDMGLFVDVFSRLKQLYKVGEKIVGVSHHNPTEREVLREQLKRCKKSIKNLAFLKVDTQMQRVEGVNVGAYFLEVLKFATLVDVAVYYALLANLPAMREAVEGIYYAIGEVDIALSVLALRGSLDYFTRPDLTGYHRFKTDGLYHPLLQSPVANDLELAANGMLITGSNMAGKSTFIKAVNVNALCGQVLNTVFAREYASREWQLATSIHTRDEIAEGSSYFLEEVDRLGLLLRYAKAAEKPYLLTIDEVFRGTNTIERISGAKAVLSYLVARDCLVLASTHDLELAELLEDTYALYHFQEAVIDEVLSFDYRLRPGVMTERNALKILALAGYPEEVVLEAKRVASSG